MSIYEQRGGEVLANTVATGHQDGAEIAHLADGRFVLVWRDASASGGDTTGRSIRGQMFNADGSRFGSEFLANSQTLGDQNDPGVTALVGGGFVAYWTDTSFNSDGSSWSVRAQRYDSGGARVGTEFIVNTKTAGVQQHPSAVGLSDGGFVFVYTDGIEVHAQFFEADGSKSGPVLLVNEPATRLQHTPTVALLADGRVAVTWADLRDEATGSDIRARILNSDGTIGGAEILVNTSLENIQERPQIGALNDGGFVVTWGDLGESGGQGIKAQVIGSNGAKVGGEIVVPQTIAGTQSGGFATGLSDGGFAIVWTGADSFGRAVKGALFDSTGARNGDEFLVNVIEVQDQHATFASRSADGGFTVAWADLSQQSGDSSGSGIKFTRFVASPATGGDDVISGTEQADTIHGLGGADTLNGLGGDDELVGGDGSDRLEGGLGADRLRGDGGGDVLNGGAGRDDLAGGADSDELYGEADDDTLAGGDSADLLSGGEGNDVIAGDGGDDVAYGGGGNDALDGGSGGDSVNGEAGDDALRVTAAAAAALDLAHGGTGTDTLTVDLRALAVAARSEAAPAGDPAAGFGGAIVSDSGHRIVYAGIEKLIVLGGSGADQFLGGLGNDSFSGGSGDDRLEGGDGNDTLDGEGGDDRLIGGRGDDVLSVDSAGDVVVEEAGEGTDTIRASIAHTLGSNLENLTGVGTAGLALTGNGGNNLITGSEGNDVIDGGAGADRMKGGNGNDIYYVDDLGDRVEEPDMFSSRFGLDEIRTALPVYRLAELVVTGPIYSYVENLTGLSTTGQSLTGNGLGNLITGNIGNDFLDGDRGADRMVGGQGDDVYVIDDVGDVVVEAAGQGVDEVRVNLTRYTLAANVENATLIFIGSPNTLTGNGLDNVLRGGAGWDTIDGGAGADTLIGGAGNDWYTIDAFDTIVEAADSSGGFDSVADVPFATYTAPVGVELVRGTSAQQTLIGNDGDNWLGSNGGNDTLIGGKGNDLYEYQPGDTIVEAEGEGIDLVRTTLSSFTLGANLEELQGVSFSIGQTLIGNALNNRIIGTILNDRTDTIDGGLGADLMTGWHGSDIYYVDNVGDVVVEESHHGTADEVRTTLAVYTLAANVEKLTGLSAGGQALTGNGLANVIVGGSGDDRLAGGLGPDQLTGGAGADRFVYTAATDSPSAVVDRILDFEAGVDKIDLTGLGSVQVTLTEFSDTGGVVYTNVGVTTGTGPMTIQVKGRMTRSDVITATVGTSGDDVLQGTGEADDIRGEGGNDRLLGHGGNDSLAGGPGNDTLIAGAGADALAGGEGNDVLYFGGDFGGEDAAQGGDGRDALVLQGNYAMVLGGANIGGIESISLQSGATTAFGDTANNSYDYDLTTADGNVPAGVQLIVNAQSLRAGEDFTFDGSAETDGRFLVYGGHGVDDLTGGSGADVFFFEGQRWGPDDRVDGGAGRDALVISGGSGTTHIEFAADALTSIESISLNNRFATDPTQTPSYELVLHNGNVAVGATLIVNGSSIPGGQQVIIDGRGVHDSNLILFAGGGHDVLYGGDGADLIVGAAGADSLTGGAGADTFRYDAASDSVGLADLIGDFQSGVDKVDLSRIDASSLVGGNQAFTWIGSNAFSGSAGQLRTYEADGYRWVAGDTNGDSVADFAIALQSGTPPLVQGDFLL